MGVGFLSGPEKEPSGAACDLATRVESPDAVRRLLQISHRRDRSEELRSQWQRRVRNATDRHAAMHQAKFSGPRTADAVGRFFVDIENYPHLRCAGCIGHPVVRPRSCFLLQRSGRVRCKTCIATAQGCCSRDAIPTNSRRRILRRGFCNADARSRRCRIPEQANLRHRAKRCSAEEKQQCPQHAPTCLHTCGARPSLRRRSHLHSARRLSPEK